MNEQKKGLGTVLKIIGELVLWTLCTWASLYTYYQAISRLFLTIFKLGSLYSDEEDVTEE